MPGNSEYQGSRRAFLAAGALASAGSVAHAPVVRAAQPNEPFKLSYAPRFGHFTTSAGPDAIDQIRYAYDLGFRAWEDNGLRRRGAEQQSRVGEALASRGMRMGVFLGHDFDVRSPTPLLASGDVAARDAFLIQVEASIDIAKRCGARWVTVAPGMAEHRLPRAYQMVNVVEALKRASAILEPHGLIMAVEPLNPFVNHPGMLLTEVSDIYFCVKAVGSPSCKLLYDVYHQQISAGNLINSIDAVYDEIGYIQVGDVPGRLEPTTGEINYLNVFRHLHGRGYQGIIGLEHGVSRPGVEGERALVHAYRASDAY